MSGLPGWAGRQGSDDARVHCWARANQVEASQRCVLMKMVPFPRGRRSCTCCTWKRGAQAWSLRGPPAAPHPFSHPQWPAVSRVTSAALTIRGSEEPVLVWRQSVTASPLLVIPPRAQGTSPEPRRQAKEPGHHSWGWGFPGCESGVLWHQPCEPAMWPSPSPPSSFIQTSLGTSLPVFSTSLQGARIISLG